MLEYRLRAATAEDVGFLADVVIEATRAQGRLGDDFNEREWRVRFGEWTMEQIRSEIPGGAIMVIEVGHERERPGFVHVGHTAQEYKLRWNPPA